MYQHCFQLFPKLYLAEYTFEIKSLLFCNISPVNKTAQFLTVRKYCENVQWRGATKVKREKARLKIHQISKEAYTVAGMQQSEKIKEQILNSRLLAESIL